MTESEMEVMVDEVFAMYAKILDITKAKYDKGCLERYAKDNELKVSYITNGEKTKRFYKEIQLMPDDFYYGREASFEPDALQDLEGEEWKPIPGYPAYLVSNMGRVKSNWLKTPRILKNRYNNKGYSQVQLHKEDGTVKQFLVNRLVGEAFCPKNEDPKMNKIVDHIDSNPANNRADNLRWTSQQKNIIYGSHAVPVACKETGEIYESISDAASAIGANYGTFIKAMNQGRAFKGQH